MQTLRQDQDERVICSAFPSKLLSGNKVRQRHEQDARSAVLSDQAKNLDWRARKATPKGRASAGELIEVRARISALLGIRSI